MGKRRIMSLILVTIVTVSMCLSQVTTGRVVKADGAPDPVSTLQAAFTAFNGSEVLYLDYTSVDGDSTVYDKVEIDNKNKVRSITSENAGTHVTTESYVDIKSKVTYTKNSSNKWEKNPADANDLINIGRVLRSNGIEPNVVAGVAYVYEGEEKAMVDDAHTDLQTEVECYKFVADIPVASSEEDEEEEEEEDEEEDDDDTGSDVAEYDDDAAPETVTVHYYIDKATGRWVYAVSDDTILSIVYPEAAAVEIKLPKEAVKSATLKKDYITTYKGVRYKVQYKKKKAYLVATGAEAKSKITVEKTVSILGKKYNVTEIGNKAFAGKKSLKTLTVKANITKIGKQAFYNSKKLKTITLKSTAIKSVGKNAFKNVPKSAKIKVPSKKKADYAKKFKKAGFKGKVK